MSPARPQLSPAHFRPRLKERNSERQALCSSQCRREILAHGRPPGSIELLERTCTNAHVEAVLLDKGTLKPLSENLSWTLASGNVASAPYHCDQVQLPSFIIQTLTVVFLKYRLVALIPSLHAD